MNKMNDMERLQFKQVKEDLYKQIWLLEILERGGEGIDDDAVYVNSLSLHRELAEHYKHDSWWERQDNFSLKDTLPERYQNQVYFIQEKFCKHLTQSDVICDLASANGEYSFMIANKVKWIDGYDLVDKMVATSKNKSQELGIKNVIFHQGNALDIKFDKIYDNFMMLGLLTCILEDKDAEKIVEKVVAAMKHEGRLIIKDSLNEGKKDLFAYNIKDGYQANYRTKDNYMNLFRKYGLTLEEEMIFEKWGGNFGNSFISLGAIWKKQ